MNIESDKIYEQELPTDQEAVASAEKTTGILKLGNSHYLIRQGSTAGVIFQPIDPKAEAAKFQDEARNLPARCHNSFEGADEGKVTVAQMGVVPPAIEWVETTRGVDRPTLKITAEDCLKHRDIRIDIFIKELNDLFLKGPAPDSRSSFLRLDTVNRELIGITIRREYPLLLMLPYTIDGIHPNPQLGLMTFLQGLDSRLYERPTTLQDLVREKGYDARIMKVLQFEKHFSNLYSKQEEIITLLYQIKASLLALRAEEGVGIDDPDLLAHMPFLKDNFSGRQASKGLLGIFKANDQPDTSLHALKIDNNIWERIVSTPNGRLLKPLQMDLF